MTIFKIIKIHRSDSDVDVTVITTKCGRELYCSKLKGDKFLDCLEYQNDDFENPIYLGHGQYIDDFKY